jgi:hypothetical protein
VTVQVIGVVGYSDEVLGIPNQRATRFQRPVQSSRAVAEEEAGAQSVASGSSIEERRVDVLAECLALVRKMFCDKGL